MYSITCTGSEPLSVPQPLLPTQSDADNNNEQSISTEEKEKHLPLLYSVISLSQCLF